MPRADDYDPLKWPPDLALAQLHLKCSRPGIDNLEGDECPCCGRHEKLKNSKWPSRNITKDFRNYGGSVPAYFSLLTYFAVCLAVLTVVIVVGHVYVLETVCPTLDSSPTPCTSAFLVFKFCNSRLLYEQLVTLGKDDLAVSFKYLQLAAYLILVSATIGMKIWLQHVNHNQIAKEQHTLSKYALIVKNIPHFQNLGMLREEIVQLGVEVCELFYVYKTADYDCAFREYLDLHFKLRHCQQRLSDGGEPTLSKQLEEYELRYLELAKTIAEKQNYKNPSKRAIVVFDSVQQRETVHGKLRINELKKWMYYTLKLFGRNSQPLAYFTESIAEPQEVHWKYIGESSTFKTKARLQTTLLGFGFMLLSFALFYFPMIKIDEEKADKPTLGTILGIFVSILIIVLAVVYRTIIVRLMPTRRPSSRLTESYFIVLTTVVFHFFFYLITPATYYIFVRAIDRNVKLKQLFLAVLTFIVMTVLVAVLDPKYLFYNRRKKKLLSLAVESGQYCQQRLHEELNPPSFPIEFKLMVVLNVWAFNAFYVFEIPYLMVIFLLVLGVLYWVDKRNLYKHYKMQSFLSIELELKVQKVYILLFLLCSSVGYAISVRDQWELYMILGVFVLAIIVNETLNYSYSKEQQETLTPEKSETFRQLVGDPNSELKSSFHHKLLEDDLKEEFFMVEDLENESLASVHYNYGYEDIYTRYLNQFSNKHMDDMLENKTAELIKRGLLPKGRAESELVGLKHQQKDHSAVAESIPLEAKHDPLHESLLQVEKQSENESKKLSNGQQFFSPAQFSRKTDSKGV